MDLHIESSSGPRVLAARHISAEKPLPTHNNALNATLLCNGLSMQPDFGTYYKALQPYAWALWGCAAVVLLATLVLFSITLRSAVKHWRGNVANVVTLLAVYPIITAAAFIVLIVPRARMLCEALSQQVVMVAMYQLYCLIVADGGGVDKIVRYFMIIYGWMEDRRAGESRLETRVLPCCCWPCCVIPRPKFGKKCFSTLRSMVLQMPIVQAFIYVVILVLCFEDMALYMRAFIYLQFFVVTSILTGVWAMIMCVRAAETSGVSAKPRFLVLQLALIVVKLQIGFAKALPEMASLPCILDLNPHVVVHLIQQFLMMVEMLALSLWAWRIYRSPPGTPAKVQQIVVAVLEDGITADKTKDGDKTINNNGAMMEMNSE